MRKVLSSLFAVVFICVTTALLLEGAFRIYLAHNVGAEVERRTSASTKPAGGLLRVWATPPWKFDRELGFSYTEGPWREALIQDRAFSACDIFRTGDHFGNVDRQPNNYFQADIKLMIVGSSFSMMSDGKNRLPNEVMMDDFAERLGRSVGILNFSRDSTGVLSYIDAAAAKIDEFKPDAVIVLANTVSLNYQRHWRVVLPDEDGFSRLWFLLDPVEHPANLSSRRAVPQTPFVSNRVSEEWCNRMAAAKAAGDVKTLTDDPALKAILAENDKIVASISTPVVTVNFWRPDMSFVWNVVRTGSPFTGVTIFGEQPVYSPMTLDRYDEDPQFVHAVERLRAHKVPVILVHLPTLPEVRANGGGFEIAANRASLIASLEQALNTRFVNLYSYYPPDYTASPERLFLSDVDFHATPLGVDVMAEALEKVLLQNDATARLFAPAAVPAHDSASQPSDDRVSNQIQ